MRGAEIGEEDAIELGRIDAVARGRLGEDRPAIEGLCRGRSATGDRRGAEDLVAERDRIDRALGFEFRRIEDQLLQALRDLVETQAHLDALPRLEELLARLSDERLREIEVLRGDVERVLARIATPLREHELALGRTGADEKHTSSTVVSVRLRRASSAPAPQRRRATRALEGVTGRRSTHGRLRRHCARAAARSCTSRSVFARDELVEDRALARPSCAGCGRGAGRARAPSPSRETTIATFASGTSTPSFRTFEVTTRREVAGVEGREDRAALLHLASGA